MAGGSKIMLHWHKKLKTYLQFGGHVELNETPWQAIAHEIREESGYTLSQLKILQPKDRLKYAGDSILHPQPAAMNTHSYPSETFTHAHIDIEYAFVANEAPAAGVEEGESDKFIYLSADELRALNPGEIIENLREVALYVLETCLPNWELVDTAEFKL
jgi:8-oxo-dGTP diphosphatase